MKSEVLFDKIEGLIVAFIESEQDKWSTASEKHKLILNKTILGEIVIKTIAYLNTIQNANPPNRFKTAGALAFWIRKLKPIIPMIELIEKDKTLIFNTNNYFLYMNERLAVFVAFSYVLAYYKQHSKNTDNVEKLLNLGTTEEGKQMLNDLIVNLRYGSFSPRSLDFIIHSIVL